MCVSVSILKCKQVIQDTANLAVCCTAWCCHLASLTALSPERDKQGRLDAEVSENDHNTMKPTHVSRNCITP